MTRVNRRKASKHLKRLERRVDYLRNRIETRRGTPTGIHHARAELGALTWALPILQGHVDQMAAEEAVSPGWQEHLVDEPQAASS